MDNIGKAEIKLILNVQYQSTGNSAIRKSQERKKQFMLGYIYDFLSLSSLL